MNVIRIPTPNPLGFSARNKNVRVGKALPPRYDAYGWPIHRHQSGADSGKTRKLIRRYHDLRRWLDFALAGIIIQSRHQSRSNGHQGQRSIPELTQMLRGLGRRLRGRGVENPLERTILP